MPGLNGTGPRGMGPMTGGGRGFCSPRGIGAAFRSYGVSPGMGAAFRSYGVSPGMGYGYPYYGAGPAAPGYAPFAPQVSQEEELGFLKGQTGTLRRQLEQIEARIQELEGGSK